MKKLLSLSIIALGLTVAYSQANMGSHGRHNISGENTVLTKSHQGKHLNTTNGLDGHNSSKQTHNGNKSHNFSKSEDKHQKAQKQKHTRHFFK